MSLADSAVMWRRASMGIAGVAGLSLGAGAAWVIVPLAAASLSATPASSVRDPGPSLDATSARCNPDRELDGRLVQRHRLARARAQSDWTAFTAAHGEPATPPEPLPPEYEPGAIAARLRASLEPGSYSLNCEYFPCIAHIRRPFDEALATSNEELVMRLGYPNASASGRASRGPTTSSIITTVYFFVDPPTRAQRHWAATLGHEIGNPFPDPE
jgi:hypothetical protein